MNLYTKLKLAGADPTRISDLYVAVWQEFEGDMVCVVFDMDENVVVASDKTIVAVEERPDAVKVEFEDGSTDVFLKNFQIWASRLQSDSSNNDIDATDDNIDSIEDASESRSMSSNHNNGKKEKLDVKDSRLSLDELSLMDKVFRLLRKIGCGCLVLIILYFLLCFLLL